MSKHISRYLLYSSYYKNPTILQRFLINTRLSQQYRLQHTKLPPKPQKPSGTLFSWKNLAVLSVASAGLVGVLKYIQNEKEAGKLFFFSNGIFFVNE